MEDKILNRIRKMLALANDKEASEGERDNALRMVHNTLAKYNMTMAQVELSGKASAEEQRGQSVVKVRSKMWMAQVANSISKLCFCYIFMTKRSDGIHLTFIGRESNRITAQEMTQYVIESIRKEGQRRAKGDSAWHLSFNKGAAARIHDRCEQLRDSAERESQGTSTGTSLVLASVYRTEQDANLAFLKALGIRLGKSGSGHSQRRTNYEAYAQGNEFGKSVSLHRQVGGGNKVSGLLGK